MKLNRETHSLCEALFELKTLQDYIADSSTPYFGKLLLKLVGVETIPFFLLSKDGFISHIGKVENHKTGKEECFTSKYFRIESIDRERCCALVSLLRPLDIYGDDTPSLCDVIKLMKTTACIEVDLSCITAIQPLDVDLLKRKIIIEPKF